MKNSTYLEMVKRNPYTLEHIENPTEEMMLEAVRRNAIDNEARAIQFIKNPSKELAEKALRKSWANLEYIHNPSEDLIRLALSCSGWALKYIDNPSEELQLAAVKKNYDAVKYIENPSVAVQEAAAAQNYAALRYIANPAFSAECIAVKNDEQALRFVKNLTPEKFIELMKVNSLIIKYMPPNFAVAVDDVEKALRQTVAAPDVDEKYIRDLINSRSIGRTVSTMPIDKIQLIDNYGSKKARRITVDEKLKFS